MKHSFSLHAAAAISIAVTAGAMAPDAPGDDPPSMFAAADSVHRLEIAGWVPHWRAREGIKSAEAHLDQLSTIHPFAFSVKRDGTLADGLNINGSHWQQLFSEAGQKNVKIIPTIMSGDGAFMHALLSDEERRSQHIAAIVEMVNDGGFDGVDIDYEAKKKETRDYFSLFLSELKGALGHKLLTCAIEARTPPESLYRTVPKQIEYSTDFEEIARYCDVVEIMTYDQQRADLLQNALKTDAPYSPVSDPLWVRKVVELAIETIPREKIMLGIPTYGREYAVVAHPSGYLEHKRVRSLNPEPALAIARRHGITPSRSRAGEADFSYVPESAFFSGSSGHVAAENALEHAKETKKKVFFNYVTWSDAEAIAEKVALAREYGLRGVAVFKFDGEEDPEMWDHLLK